MPPHVGLNVFPVHGLVHEIVEQRIDESSLLLYIMYRKVRI